MNSLLKECALDEKCAYISENSQTTHYKIIERCSKEKCAVLIERGWRRFGNMFFRPICQECNSCESIKIDVANYKFSKSQRRVLKKAQHFQSKLQEPSMSKEHLALFLKYHHHMEHKREWENHGVSANSYYSSFVHGYGDFGYEILYYDDDKLIGVDLVDILPDGISSIYFYYDPDYEPFSLGTYTILKQIELAKEKNLAWIYLGYYVQECQSLNYKNRYKPYHTLQGRPSELNLPLWLPSV
ncbi:MAG: arginyltransferase [Campylobacterota bacterium]|nr:arginyltransferase [Campylobacterota bacterium]